MINPAVVEGQIAGGLAQAIGMVLLEEVRFDDRGNPLAATYKDYRLPAIADIPDFEFVHAGTPSQSVGGMRGCGEGGAIIGAPALVNAIADALEVMYKDPGLRRQFAQAGREKVMEEFDLEKNASILSHTSSLESCG